MKGTRIKRSRSEYFVYSIVFLIFFVFAGSYVLAYLWGVMSAMNTHTNIYLNPFKFPKVWHPENFIEAFKQFKHNDTDMLGMIGNSLWLVFGASTLSILGPTLMAYATTKYKFVGRKALITINILTMIIPIMGTLPAQYRLYGKFGFLDSPLLLIAYFSCFGSTNLYLTAFFKNLSWEYAEAAIIDGAGHYTVLFRIMLPLAKGPIMALFVMQCVGIWNDYMTALLFLPSYPTLATGIYLFQRWVIYRSTMHILFAALILSSIPGLIIYICFNKTILTNVSLGGLKG